MKMSKRLVGIPLVVLLTLMLSVMLLTTSASASSWPADRPAELENATWTELPKDDGTLASGNYYIYDYDGVYELTENLTIGDGVTVNLHLNNNILMGSSTNPGSVITVNGGGVLNLYDVIDDNDNDGHEPTDRYWDVSASAIADGTGGADDLAFTGGAITGGDTPNDVYGGGVNVVGTTEGGIATFTMHGGNIVGNKAWQGGGVNAHSDGAGGIFTMNSGSIIGNTSTQSGGGVRVLNSSSIFTINGGSISGNKAGMEGGGIYNYSGTLTMTAGSITDNTATGNGGGVLVVSAANFNLSGDVTITGNTKVDGTTADNVYLSRNKTITLTGALGNSAAIGVTTETAPASAAPVTVATGAGATEASLAKFTSDNDQGILAFDTDKIVLNAHQRPTDHIQNGLTGNETWQVLGEDPSTIDYSDNNTAYVYLNGDVDLASNITVERDQILHLHLNDNIITSNFSGSIIYLDFDSELYLYDVASGTQRHWDGDSIEAGESTTDGHYNFTGGAITGGYVTLGGAGLNINGIATMSGGNIVGNTAPRGGGVAVFNTGTFNMSGGAIIGNTSQVSASDNSSGKGAGVYVQGTFKASGDVTIIGNKRVDGSVISESNVYLIENNTFELGSNLPDGATVGITTERTPTNKEDMIVVSNASPSDLDNFVSDNNQGILRSNYNSAGVYLRGHVPTDSVVDLNGDEDYWDDGELSGNETWQVLGADPSTIDYSDNNTAYVFLNGDANLASNITVSSGQTLYLHLNDNILTGDGSGSVITVNSGGTLYIYDVTSGTARYWNGTAIVTTDDGNDIAFTGGAITGGNSTTNGGGISVGGTFNMYGGNIVGNKASPSGGVGSAGGGINVTGAVTMHGGSIIGNSASGVGGGVSISTGGTLNLIDGTINNNIADAGGGGVYVVTTFNMYGGNIQGNSSGINGVGGGVLVETNGTFNASGDVTITSNTESHASYITASNVYLPTGNTITLTDALGDMSEIHVTMESSARPVDVAVGATSPAYTITNSDLAHIISEVGETHTLNSNSNKIYIKGPQPTDPTGNGLTGHETWQVLGADPSTIDYSDNNTAYVFLADDVQLTTNITVADGQTLHLHLNDKVLKGTGDGSVITVNGTGELYLYDVTSGTTKYWNGTTIVTADDGDDLAFTGGAITGGTGTLQNNGFYRGGGIFSEGSVTMYGGNIVGNKIIGVYTGGGGVAVIGSTAVFNMSGGSIVGNTSAGGGGVYLEGWAEMDMSGSAFIGYNEAPASQGGGVYINDDSTVTMRGGAEISHNTAGRGGGGIYIVSDGILNMQGGSITDNTSGWDGGGGVYVLATINLSGDVRITNNTEVTADGTTANNVSLGSNNTITLTDELGANAQIGVTTASDPTADSAVDVAMGGTPSAYTITDDDLAKFSSDNNQGTLSLDATNNKIVLGVYVPPSTGGGGSGTTEPEVDEDGTVETTVDVSSSTQDGSTTAQVDKDAITDALEKGTASLEDAKEGETEAKLVVTIDIPTTSDTTEVITELPIDSMTELSGSAAEELRVESDKGTVTFDKTALDSIAKQAEELKETEDDVLKLVVRKVEDKAELTDEQQEIVGESPVYELYLEVGGKRITDFGGGTVTVEIPEALRTEDAENLKVYFVDDEGKIYAVAATYDAEAGTVTFVTTHFSYYLITTQTMFVTLPFTDVSAEDWFYEAVQYVYQTELMSGTSETTFEPNLGTTRAMIVTILYRLEGTPETAYSNVFEDVADGMWYSEAVIWAAENGVVTGYGNGMFGPDDNITREQLAAMLYRYGEYKGYDLSATADITTFVDGDTVSDWATVNMQWAIGSGLITGRGESTLAPTEGATRGELATVLMRYRDFVR